ncbi:hypothetical protein PHYPSEUDO_010917 [Phytophthora pseudosyringae]|uniref:Uncharacterized protein n=1 Tax=Phytophthora pseudosyringae TaxID=221518 RepID=A0A8T1VC37_9STRA|nr:hypothetical protein PHYPSEUDO_010917 [Phytophthora pseudosyringae]
MASTPGVMAPASPRSDAASGHDTDTPGAFQRGKRKYSHTTAAQRQCLLEWLELPGNFELLTKPVSATLSESAASSSASPPPKRVKKIHGYRSLAQYMNRVALTDWSEKTARSRFESFMAAYRKAKRESPPDAQLPTFYQRVDALFGPEGDREATRFRSESLGQRSEGCRSPLMATRETGTSFQELTRGDELGATSPPRRRARTTATRPVETDGGADEPAASSPLQELTRTTTATARLESQRLAVRQQELELKQSELRARQEENRQKLRAEVLTRLVEAGKSPAEVREYLAIMDPVANDPATRR